MGNDSAGSGLMAAPRAEFRTSVLLVLPYCSSVDLVRGLDADFGGAVGLVGDGHVPGAAADLAVLHVLLMRAAAGVQRDLYRLAAVRAGDGGRRVGGAVADGEGVLDRFVAAHEGVGVQAVAHEVTPRRSGAPGCASAARGRRRRGGPAPRARPPRAPMRRKGSART